jgi:serine phosphatase RsbU (regulator of sigma subunit)
VLGANFKHFSKALKEKELEWKKGDVVVLFTDGATEARNTQKESFQMINLQKAIEQYAHLPVQEMISSILQTILQFIGNAPQHDDITLLGLKYCD